ncbi:SulP family inorganic anion transporter [Aquibaculum arenosum]|uniref:Sulfate permease n=1 Tax=Aquibaculum arenosum TaxID=3032591 RepID=A0ABT5YPI4_9PROT|nr:sulfate permease [Fodinicurvata sp. CAU 1616]MDF2096863.1 sulfate permease [Fodinicurvata sp. CAU 1616]
MAETQRPTPTASPAWHLFVPKLITTLRQGYGMGDLRHDLIAGLTVAIVALPLAMALAIASGTTPDKGLVTAVVAGFLISALGGSRFQIGGPTGAFVVVVFNVIAEHGYDGLVLATLMAGAMLIVAAIARLGTWIKYIPEPVVIGFTAGIGLIILSSQIRDFFGLSLDSVPGDFLERLGVFWAARDSLSLITFVLAGASLALILGLRRWAPKLPGFLLAVAGASLIVLIFGLPVDTIGSRFGGIPSSLPAPVWPEITLERMGILLPSAFTIAFLAGVESLLSAVIADGMTGRRHRSNCELMAQGVANIGSAFFGGLPATGAIARTATNIRAGARSPVSGILHAVFLLLFMLLLAPLAYWVPLAALAAILVVVAWNMSEVGKLTHLLLRAPLGDRLVMVLTFLLTVLVDLTVAIQVGVVLAAILFMHRMAGLVAVEKGDAVLQRDIDDFQRDPEAYDQRDALPSGVEVFQMRGPLFFGAASTVGDLLDSVGEPPRVFILRMREVPMIDASGAEALAGLVRRAAAHGTKVIVTSVQPEVAAVLQRMDLGPQSGRLVHAADYGEALALARAV